jgi:hypothetical protein
MIAEIEPRGRCAEIFAELTNGIAGRVEMRKAKRGLFDPFLSKFSSKKA